MNQSRIALILAPALLLGAADAPAASFNCKAAAAKKCPERTVCAERDLSSLDDQLDKLYVTWRGALKNESAKEAARDEQAHWLKHRNACGCDAVCLIDAYDGRVTELSRAVGQAYGSPRPNAGAKYIASRAGRWERLGAHTVTMLRKDQDVIEVGRAGGFFTAINIKVARNRVHFYDVKVVYGNNEEDDLQVRRLVPAGGETGELKLNLEKYQSRVIKQIVLTYRSGFSLRGRATVVVEGKHG
jgi:uncharacterized protein